MIIVFDFLTDLNAFRSIGSMILSLAYGLDVQSHDHPILEMVETHMEIVSKTTMPGAFLVDTIPARMLCNLKIPRVTELTCL